MDELIDPTPDWDALEAEANAFLKQCGKRDKRLLNTTFLGLIAMVFAAFVFAIWQLPDMGIVGSAFSLLFGLTGYLAYNITVRKSQGTRLAYRLMSSDDPRAIPLLLEMSLIDALADGQLQANIGHSFRYLLPKVREQHAHLFKPRHLATLYWLHKGSLSHQRRRNRWLNASRGHDLSLGVLQALGYVGDERTLKWLTQVVESPTHTAEEHEQQHVAEQSLLALQARLAAKRERDTYLRASSQPDSVELLLRPAQQSQEQTELLLRPTNGQE